MWRKIEEYIIISITSLKVIIGKPIHQRTLIYGGFFNYLIFFSTYTSQMMCSFILDNIVLKITNWIHLLRMCKIEIKVEVMSHVTRT